MKLEFFRKIFEKWSNIKFHENLFSGSRLATCGRTERNSDRHDAANSHFSPPRERAWKATTKTPLPFVYWQESTSVFLSLGISQYFECKRGIRFFYSCVALLISFFGVANQPDVGLGRLIVEVSRSHTIRDTHSHGSTPLNERSAHPTGRYLHNTQQTQLSDNMAAQPPGSTISNYYGEIKV